jgi:hypothetical protein
MFEKRGMPIIVVAADPSLSTRIHQVKQPSNNTVESTVCSKKTFKQKATTRRTTAAVVGRTPVP